VILKIKVSNMIICKKTLFFILIITIGLLQRVVYSAEFEIWYSSWSSIEERSEKEYITISINGDIKKGDAKKFDAFLKSVKGRQKPILRAILNSNGANIFEAITIGDIIRKNLITTTVDEFCRSACFLIWAQVYTGLHLRKK
jgi:hypothetical protein